MKQEKPQLSDERIAALVQKGDIDLFRILIQRYKEKMTRYARKFLYNKEDINDIIQEVFIKTYINIQSFDVKRKFSSWLYRIAHNELINAIKKKRTLPLFDLDVFLPYELHDNTLKQEIARQDMYKIIDKCLNQLEPKYREPIILHYFEELSYKEIADVMQIPISTVGIRIKRAKEMMKSIFNKSKYTYE